MATWPTDSVRTKNWGTEILTDADLEAQLDLLHTWINDAFDESTGHKHDGTTNEGPLIQLNGANIGVTGELQETDGGTGLSAYTLGDILYASAANTLAVLAKNTSESRYLSNQGASNIPQWEQVDIATGIAIASEAQGDVLYRGASNWARLGAGTAGQALTTGGAAANPSWVSPFGKLLSKTTISTATNSGDITVAANKIYLVVFEFFLSTSADTTVSLRVNSDSSASYVEPGASGQTAITIGTADNNSGKAYMNGQFMMFTTNTIKTFWVNGQAVHYNAGGTDLTTKSINGFIDKATAISSYEFVFDQASSGTVYTYEFGLTA